METINLTLTAELLIEAAIAVSNYWLNNHHGRAVVVLGRDGWPLVPLLRQMGVPTQYFVFSRLQIGDEGTALQWVKEVPPNALVVDTGFMGSIFNAIKAFDPSISGVLLCSDGDWPQVEFEGQVEHRYVVHNVEKLPKIVGRGVTTNSRGHVRCPQDTRDADESIEGLSPAGVADLNRQLCSLLEVDQCWATFTGLTPETRVVGPLDQHYKLVALERALTGCCPSAHDIGAAMAAANCLDHYAGEDSMGCWEPKMTVVKANCPEFGFMEAVDIPLGFSGKIGVPTFAKGQYPDACWHVHGNVPGYYAVAEKLPWTVIEPDEGGPGLRVRWEVPEAGFAVAEGINNDAQKWAEFYQSQDCDGYW